MTAETQIGTAATDITPPIGALLVNYAPRRSARIGHPLRADSLPAPGSGGEIRLIESVPRATVAPGGRLTWSLSVPPNGTVEVTYTVQAVYAADKPPALLQSLLPREP